MDKNSVKTLKEYLASRGVLNVQNKDLIDDAIYQWINNNYLAKKRLQALADNLKRDGHREELATVARFL